MDHLDFHVAPQRLAHKVRSEPSIRAQSVSVLLIYSPVAEKNT